MRPDNLASKQAMAAITIIALEGAKHDATSSELTCAHSPRCQLPLILLVVGCRSILEEGKLSPAQIKSFVTLFSQNKAAIRESLLSATALSFPSIVDVEWRLDYYVKSNSLEQQIGRAHV